MPYDLDRLQRDVAQIQHYDAGFASGRLVAENLFLTAAHALWNEERSTEPFTKEWQVRLARDRSAGAWPFRRGNTVVRYDRGFDLALIELIEPEGGPLRPELRMRVATISQSNPHYVEARGYPLQDGPDEDEIWIYGVVQSVPTNYAGQLTVARLPDAWQNPEFRALLEKSGAPREDAKDPSRFDIDYDVTDATASIRMLQKLVRDVPAVAGAVGSSREAVQNTARQIDSLALFKTIHDVLHDIEFNCFRAMQVEPSASPVRPHKVNFDQERRKILACIVGHDMPNDLHDDLVEGLDSAALASRFSVSRCAQ